MIKMSGSRRIYFLLASLLGLEIHHELFAMSLILMYGVFNSHNNLLTSSIKLISRRKHVSEIRKTEYHKLVKKKAIASPSLKYVWHSGDQRYTL